ncbi:hypothetical protein BJF79_20170 [Actinomadura sp. CNU-125]|nr:hypothetical protein BJF79_20170 [Actinomadura sp. CNU-125]
MDAFAAETGLDRPVLPWHTRRTPVADLGAALAVTAGALGKIATDVQLLAQSEIDEVGEPPDPAAAARRRCRTSATPRCPR